ncbi:MAG: S41 family peptidase [Flavobacteriaceae bacterium]|nr:S41 family peptidase [Flavobacteriaceae bacterium]NNK28675.1 S41 family peptidase [Flavobacteriaceae bacterium]RZV64340.1 MAG: S41 family peptidase [Flavobacteriaceae bacterium]
MKTNKNIFLPTILGVALAAGVYIGGKLGFEDTSDRLFTSNSKKDKLNRLIDYIDYEYVDEVNTDSIVDVTVNGILDNLDPHSVYIPESEMTRITENMKGDFVGIGINFYRTSDTVTVIRSIKNGPSDKAGLKGGDRILYANGERIFGPNITEEDIFNNLKGEVDTKVKLVVYRKGEEKLLNFTVVRDNVPIRSVDASFMLTNNLGYIKINRFAESTYKEFKKALDYLQDQGATQVALDLRNNPGGFLSIAESIVDEFLEDDKLILFTKNKKGKIEKSYATKKGDFEEGHVFVLINENSASASEIVAGALQDNDKGTIVGRRSYGKGLVQREMALGDGSAVRLTVSRYYTPTGRSIQRSYENGNRDYYDEYFDRLDSGELLSPEKIKVNDSLKFKTPKGKTVYGGGGIIPDIFVPMDIGMENETIDHMLRRGVFSNFVFKELDQDRDYYEGVTPEDFIENFVVSDDIVVRFQEHLYRLLNRNITFVAYNEEVKLYIKATLGEQLYDRNVFEKIIGKRDEMIEEVIKLSKGE